MIQPGSYERYEFHGGVARQQGSIITQIGGVAMQHRQHLITTGLNEIENWNEYCTENAVKKFL